MHILFKKIEDGEPPSPRQEISLGRDLQVLFIGHGVVPPKQPCCDVIRNDDIDRVVFVRHEDADDPSGAQQPADQVVPPEVTR